MLRQNVTFSVTLFFQFLILNQSCKVESSFGVRTKPTVGRFRAKDKGHKGLIIVLLNKPKVEATPGNAWFVQMSSGDYFRLGGVG